MSLHSDLLAQAGLLSRHEPRRPKQASLRRAVSTAYYSLFHLLIHESVHHLLGSGSGEKGLRSCLSRAYAHAAMKEVAAGFSNGRPSSKLSVALQGVAVQPNLVNVASAFLELQQARHEADYDTGKRFTRTEVQDLVSLATRAFADWQSVRGTPQANVFLVAILAQKLMLS